MVDNLCSPLSPQEEASKLMNMEKIQGTISLCLSTNKSPNHQWMLGWNLYIVVPEPYRLILNKSSKKKQLELSKLQKQICQRERKGRVKSYDFCGERKEKNQLISLTHDLIYTYTYEMKSMLTSNALAMLVRRHVWNIKSNNQQPLSMKEFTTSPSGDGMFIYVPLKSMTNQIYVIFKRNTKCRKNVHDI